MMGVTQEWIVMTSEQKDAAVLLDSPSGYLGPQEITNPLANNLGYGVLVGKWVAPARLLNDPGYVAFVPTLSLLPIYVLDSDTIFPPPSNEV